MSRFVRGFRKYFRLYIRCARTAVSAAVAYRMNFAAGMIITFFSNILFPLVTIVIYGAGLSFPGWTFYQVLLIQSIFTVSSGISNMFFQGIFRETNNAVRDGVFEIILLKPVEPLFYLAATSINPESSALVAGGCVMFGLSAAHVPGITGAAVPVFMLFILAGICVMLGLTLVMAAVSFKWVGNSRLPELFGSVLELAKYPLGIYPHSVRTFSTFIIPVALVASIPAAVLTGRVESSYIAAVIPCILLVLTGIVLYKRMIRMYESAGG
jgi:ABC-2 type transport system permease protein